MDGHADGHIFDFSEHRGKPESSFFSEFSGITLTNPRIDISLVHIPSRMAALPAPFHRTSTEVIKTSARISTLGVPTTTTAICL